MDSIELTTHSQPSGCTEEGGESPTTPAEELRGAEFQLAPVDRGRRAWTLLGAAFVFEALLWG